jgi:hypothetical protein
MSAFLMSACAGPVPGNETDPEQVVEKGGVKPPPGLPVLASVTFSPSTVAGGSPATGTLTFQTVTDGAVVTLSSSNPAVVMVPASSVVAGGQSTGVFPITTAAVTSNTSVTITASSFGVTVTGTLLVTPATTPPTTDTVTIQSATWQAGRLRIQAQSTNPNAILSSYLTADGSFMFTLLNKGGGHYEIDTQEVSNPLSITIRSNFGGSATHSTTK